MSQDGDAVDAPTKIARIPSLLTNSCRAILEVFGDTIIQLRAHGSVATTNQTIVDELREYGLIREQETNHRVSIDYTQIQNTHESGVSNPLTKDAIDSIQEHINAILDIDAINVEPDLAVTSVTIRVTNERLQAVTSAQTPEFDLQFVADPAEEPFRPQTRRANAGRGLYSELGFNIQNLNLRSAIETKTKYTEQSDGRYLSWQGPNDVLPRSPEKLAIRINQEVLPEQYGTLKPYHVTDDQVLEIVEDEVETLDAQQQPTANGGNQ